MSFLWALLTTHDLSAVSEVASAHCCFSVHKRDSTRIRSKWCISTFPYFNSKRPTSSHTGIYSTDTIIHHYVTTLLNTKKNMQIENTVYEQKQTRRTPYTDIKRIIDSQKTTHWSKYKLKAYFIKNVCTPFVFNYICSWFQFRLVNTLMHI